MRVKGYMLLVMQLCCADMVKEARINSINVTHKPRITNDCVEKLSNSGAITHASRLGFGDSASYELLSRVNQNFLRGE